MFNAIINSCTGNGAGKGGSAAGIPTSGMLLRNQLGRKEGAYYFKGNNYFTITKTQTIGAEYPDKPHFSCTFYPIAPHDTEVLYSPYVTERGLFLSSVGSAIKWFGNGASSTEIGTYKECVKNTIELYFKTGAYKAIVNEIEVEITGITWTATSWTTCDIGQAHNTNDQRFSGLMPKFSLGSETFTAHSLIGSLGTTATPTDPDSALMTKWISTGLTGTDADYMIINDDDSVFVNPSDDAEVTTASTWTSATVKTPAELALYTGPRIFYRVKDTQLLLYEADLTGDDLTRVTNWMG